MVKSAAQYNLSYVVRMGSTHVLVDMGVLPCTSRLSPKSLTCKANQHLNISSNDSDAKKSTQLQCKLTSLMHWQRPYAQGDETQHLDCETAPCVGLSMAPVEVHT